MWFNYIIQFLADRTKCLLRDIVFEISHKSRTLHCNILSGKISCQCEVRHIMKYINCFKRRDFLLCN